MAAVKGKKPRIEWRQSQVTGGAVQLFAIDLFPDRLGGVLPAPPGGRRQGREEADK